MSLHSTLHAGVLSALDSLTLSGALPEGLPTQNIVVESPRDPNHGDAATNAALVLGKISGLGPKVLAEKLVDALKTHPLIENASIAGPGFVNIHLSTQALGDTLSQAITDPQWGQDNLGQGQSILLEYLSANPTGPVHVGHTRGAVLGDVLARLWSAAGYKIHREYYVNDAGGQMDTLARSIYKRYEEAAGRDIEITPGLYPGDYLKPVGAMVFDTVGDAWLDKNEDVWLDKMRSMGAMAMLTLIQEDIDLLGISFDSYFSEKNMEKSKTIEVAMKYIELQGLLAKETLEDTTEKGDVDGREQTVFTSTLYGDDKNRAIQKSDGSWTYFAGDLGYHWDKIQRNPDKLVTILGADHSGYVKRIQAATHALSKGETTLDVHLVQLVHLLKDNKPFQMSKRAGTFITLKDLVEAVGKDAVRFFMMARDCNSVLNFDFDLVVSTSRENPLYYIQYAHARCASVMEKAGNPDTDTLADIDVAHLTFAQRNVAGQISLWPKVFKAACEGAKPHLICTYLSELAAAYHSAWHAGYDAPSERMLSDENPEGLVLTKATQNIISQGLGLLGITPSNKM